MQNQTKKILASALFAVLGLGMLWAVGQSQATPSSTTNNIIIKDIERNQSSKLKTLFLAEEKAGQTNTNPSSIEKVRLVIDEKGSLNTFATSRLLDDSQKRQSSNKESEGSVVGGIRNHNEQKTSIIIGGEDNTIQGNQGFIGGGSANTVIKANSSVLGSSGVKLEGANTFAIGSNGVNILADNATAIAGKNISIAKTAEGSLAIGNQITIATPGTFAFNTKSEKLSPQIEHSFVVNTDYGVLVNKHKSVDPKIQLNVGGAIRVGEVAKSSTIPALVQKSHGGSYSCVCFGTTAITQTDACQQICSGQNPNIKPKCGPNAKAYGKDDNNWAAGTDEPSFCEKGRLDTNFQKLYPQPGDQVSWKCKGINQPDITCEANRYFCGDGKKQTGEQCDAGVLNGDPQSNCSTTCKTVAAPACGSNASAYTHTATTWKNQTAKGFCSEGTIKGTQPPFFTPAPITLPTAPSCNKCGLKGFPYCFDVSFDPNSEACRDTNIPITGETQKNWTCKNANNAEVHCEATRPLPKPGQCGTAHNVLKDNLTTTSSDLCQQGTVSDFGEDTTKFTNRWSWKCQGTANTPAASCTAHKPQPQAGQCGTTLNSCNAGTPETNSTLTNGTRWICKGANQGEDTVCNVCNHNYTYNQDTNTCIPKTEQVQCAKTGAPANASYVAGTVNVTWNGQERSTPANCAWTCNSGYTQQGNSCVKDAPVCDTANGFSLHNGHCAKWSCGSTGSTTAGRCEGNNSKNSSSVCKNISDQRCKIAVEVKQHCQDSASTCGILDNYWIGKNPGIARPILHPINLVEQYMPQQGYGANLRSLGGNSHAEFGYELVGLCKWLPLKQYICIQEDGSLLTDQDCNPNWQKPDCSYGWTTQPHGVCQYRSFSSLNEEACIAKAGPSATKDMKKCVGLNKIQCMMNEDCILSQPTMEVKDRRVFCTDSNRIEVDSRLCDIREKPLSYGYCENSNVYIPNTCYEKDRATILGNGRVNTILGWSTNLIGTIEQDLARSGEFYLDARSGRESAYLYLPISYGAFSPETPVHGSVKIKATISNGVGGIYENTVGTYPIITRSETYGGLQYVKVLFNKQMHNGHILNNIPCSTAGKCIINILETQLELPDIPYSC